MNTYDHIKLENQLCFPLYAISREIIKRYKPVLDPFNLTYTQYITMLVLWEEEKITFKRLGEKLHLDSGTLTPVLRKLEAMQYIHKYRSKEDDRVVIVEVSKEGYKLKEEIINVPAQVACHIDLSSEEALVLKEILDKLLTKFD